MFKNLLLVFLLLQAVVVSAQKVPANGKAKPTSKSATVRGTEMKPFQSGDGYMVYKRTEIRGHIELYPQGVYLERSMNDTLHFSCSERFDDTALKIVVIYKGQGKMLCLARATDDDRAMMRLVHEGKLMIFDDNLKDVYSFSNLHRQGIVIAYNGDATNLRGLQPDAAKQKLAEWVNAIYGLKLDTRAITWEALMKKVELLDGE